MTPDKVALRIVLADDHHFSREGLRAELEADGMAVVGEAADGAETVTIVASLAPDVVVLDLRMPGTSGLHALREITAASAGVPIVVLTVSAEEEDIFDALAGGARGYLLKETPVEELVSAIRQVAGGHAVLCDAAMRVLAARLRAEGHAADRAARARPALSVRELQVLRLIVAGADNVSIGHELSISRHTVKQHVTNILQKLNVSSRVEAAVRAVRERLV